MENKFLYLDYAATAPLSYTVTNNLYESKEYFGNPASMHKEGELAYATIKQCKANILQNLKHSMEDWDILFTSGATESINTIFSAVKPGIIVTTKNEHHAVYSVAESLNTLVIKVDSVLTDFELNLPYVLSESAVILISIIGVNNETGEIFPLERLTKIKAMLKKHFPNNTIITHVDFTQGFCKIDYDMTDVDCYSFSGHKIGFFKGFGGLVYRKNTVLPYLKKNPFILGGGQQNNLRSGTENAQFIWLFDKLVEYNMTNLSRNATKAFLMRTALIHVLKDTFSNIKIIDNSNTKFSPYILSVSFPDIEGESIMSMLADKNISVSTGSACSSDNLLGSSVIFNYYKNQNLSEDECQRLSNGTIRISYDATIDLDDIVDMFLPNYIDTIKELKRRSI